VAEVFEVIVNPAVTSKYWFSKGSGRLKSGKRVRWDWESHDVSIDVTAKAVEPTRASLPNGRAIPAQRLSNGRFRPSLTEPPCTCPGSRLDRRCGQVGALRRGLHAGLYADACGPEGAA
jgi:hypothetical protein